MKIGIALGSGAARGWAHFGVLKALAERDIRPDIVAGSSIGSLIGAALASCQLDSLQDWVESIDRLEVFRMLDAGFAGGVMTGKRVISKLENYFEDANIESLDTPFAAVATELYGGREIWLREGSMLAAARASSAMPGLFSPSRHKDTWLIDGGLVNPVPVSVCHAMGAEVIIAVNLNTYLHTKRRASQRGAQRRQSPDKDERSYTTKIKTFFDSWLSSDDETGDSPPDMLDVVYSSINVMQERITRSRLAGEPPFVEIRPTVDGIAFWEFDRSAEAMQAGYDAVVDADKRLTELKSFMS